MGVAAVIWKEVDGWHYKLAKSLSEALALEAHLTLAQQFEAFCAEANSMEALRGSYWQIAAADASDAHA